MPAATVAAARRMLQEGVSVAEIARTLKISESSANRIRAGVYRPAGRRPVKEAAPASASRNPLSAVIVRARIYHKTERGRRERMQPLSESVEQILAIDPQLFEAVQRERALSLLGKRNEPFEEEVA